ncbi:unnamed protein product [Trichogramma brassicae]|uniref:Uncharacterized protein n=1 Tax=Trichogramma brassicae TaxID=86971 RepID=A0A6H5IRJ2_9HYME|nr:unnamed protein product [Trichogramma brassicae]
MSYSRSQKQGAALRLVNTLAGVRCPLVCGALCKQFQNPCPPITSLIPRNLWIDELIESVSTTYADPIIVYRSRKSTKKRSSGFQRNKKSINVNDRAANLCTQPREPSGRNRVKLLQTAKSISPVNSAPVHTLQAAASQRQALHNQLRELHRCVRCILYTRKHDSELAHRQTRAWRHRFTLERSATAGLLRCARDSSKEPRIDIMCIDRYERNTTSSTEKQKKPTTSAAVMDFLRRSFRRTGRIGPHGQRRAATMYVVEPTSNGDVSPKSYHPREAQQLYQQMQQQQQQQQQQQSQQQPQQQQQQRRHHHHRSHGKSSKKHVEVVAEAKADQAASERGGTHIATTVKNTVRRLLRRTKSHREAAPMPLATPTPPSARRASSRISNSNTDTNSEATTICASEQVVPEEEAATVLVNPAVAKVAKDDKAAEKRDDAAPAEQSSKSDEFKGVELRVKEPKRIANGDVKRSSSVRQQQLLKQEAHRQQKHGQKLVIDAAAKNKSNHKSAVTNRDVARLKQAAKAQQAKVRPMQTLTFFFYENGNENKPKTNANVRRYDHCLEKFNSERCSRAIDLIRDSRESKNDLRRNAEMYITREALSTRARESKRCVESGDPRCWVLSCAREKPSAVQQSAARGAVQCSAAQLGPYVGARRAATAVRVAAAAAETTTAQQQYDERERKTSRFGDNDDLAHVQQSS